MAKMKSGDIGTDRAVDKLRDIEVTLDFTPNADASVLYRQGETMVLACATVAPSLPSMVSSRRQQRMGACRVCPTARFYRFTLPA